MNAPTGSPQNPTLSVQTQAQSQAQSQTHGESVTEKRPLKVLLWSVGGAGAHYGGPGTSAWRLYRAAKPGRFDVTLAHGCVEQQSYDAFGRMHLIRPIKHSAIGQLAYIRAGKRWIRRHAREFDVFHGLQGFELTVSAALAAKRAGLPAVVKLAAHESDFADKPVWRHRLLRLAQRRRQRARELDALIAISHDIRDELLGYGFPESKIALIPNGVDTERFAPIDDAGRRGARKALGWPDRPTLLYVGGIMPRKRPTLLVEILADLRKQGGATADLQLAIVGPERYPGHEAVVRAAAVANGVADHIIWQGHLPDIAPAYRASDVYALPSINEGMPNALLEAMASGLPSVATPISGSRDLIEDGMSGVLCPPDRGATGEAIGAYFNDPALARRHGTSARERIEKKFSADAVLDAHEALFRHIMRG